LINNGANAANAANAPAITATGNPPGGVSAVANAGVDQGSPIMRMSPEARAAIAAGRASPMPQLQPTGSMADTFSRLAGNLSSEMGRMFSPAERAYYMNPAQRRF
jgi:hypothetical protein